MILGAGGGVGSFAVQFAKRVGARVIATASREDFTFLEEMGASQMLDYKTERFEDTVKDMDIVIDLVGGETLSRAYRTARQNGLIITTVGPVDETEAMTYNVRAIPFTMKSDPDELEQIGRLVEAGNVKPRISKVMSLAEARDAEDLIQLGHPHGKVILHVA